MVQELMQLAISHNPCLSCGACCAHLRVSFYWSEANAEFGGTVPVELTEKLTPFLSCMKGTNQPQPRCIALQGEIGQAVACTIYAQRSTPCQEFGVYWEDGLLHADLWEVERCERSCAAYGLPPLASLGNEWDEEPAEPVGNLNHPLHRTRG